MKTLKDLKFVHDFNGERDGFSAYMINPIDLKQAAIEWVKAFEKGECWTDFAADQRHGQENIVEWIHHFFGLTEEDVK